MRLPVALTTRTARLLLSTKAHSPTLLFVAGVGGALTATVLACRATLHVDEILEEAEKNMQKVQTMVDAKVPTYTEKMHREDLFTIRAKTAVGITKLYAPAVVVGIVAIGCLAGSHSILLRRNAAITAAYTALDQTYRSYRRRVVEEVGEDKEHQLHYEAMQEQSHEAPQIKGTKTLAPRSTYARWFDDSSHNWDKQPDYNFLFLRCQQNWANDRLQTKGHIFLNEVYDALDLPRTQAGTVVGWVKGNGDGYVDFGIFDGQTENARKFLNGSEPYVLLDFNVDGVIWNRIKEER